MKSFFIEIINNSQELALIFVTINCISKKIIFPKKKIFIFARIIIVIPLIYDATFL